MKPMMILVTTALFALPALAAPPQRAPQQPVRRVSVLVKPAPAPAPAVLTGQDAIVANYLQLTDDQRQQWADFRKDSGTNVKPLLDEQRDLQRQLAAAIAAGSDTCAIGELTMSLHRLNDQIAAAQNLTGEQMSDLTSDQQMKFQAFMAALTYLRQH